MKINKIKMIENPKEDIILSDESLDALLGGEVCENYEFGICHKYYENAECSYPGDYAGMKCGVFRLV